MKLNIFWYGENNSHCGSCWESSDEHLWILITPSSLEEIIEKFSEYLSSCDECFSYIEFLDSIQNLGVYFNGIMGKSYLPEVQGDLLEKVYELNTCLIPEFIVGEKYWKSLQDKWLKNKKKNQEIKEKMERIRQELAEEKRLKKLEEYQYKEFLELKKKFEKIKTP